MAEKIQFVSLEDILSEDLSVVTEKIPIQLINGKYIELEIKSITQEEEVKIRKRCTKYEGSKKGVRTPVLDEVLYSSLMIAAATDVDWKKFAEKVGAQVPAPEFIIPKLFSMGGIVRATQGITRLSGIDEDMEDLIEAAKN